MDYLCNVESNKEKNVQFVSARNRILSYRVNQAEQNKKEVLAEGYDDDGEEGAGEKLLGLLQKMDIGNILVVVCMWSNNISMGEMRMNAGELYRVISE